LAPGDKQGYDILKGAENTLKGAELCGSGSNQTTANPFILALKTSWDLLNQRSFPRPAVLSRS